MKSPIIADFHSHSSFSSDSDTPMEQMIQAAVDKGLKYLCFTEHMDKDFPVTNGLDFLLDTPAYLKEFLQMKEKYKKQIHLLFGVELGLQPHLKDWMNAYISEFPFDFIIGSSHLCNGRDPYYPEFFQGRSEDEAYLEYFESILTNLDAYSDFDIYGHIDYVVRYGPNKNQFYTYQKYREILDAILEKIIDLNLGIELNTGGFKYGLGHPNPCEEVLIRYRQLGGELITIGSDGHRPQELAYDFDKAAQVMKDCGFTHYAIYEKRTPVFLPLDAE